MRHRRSIREKGADIDNGGYGWFPVCDTLIQYQLICNTPLPLNGWDASLPNNGPPAGKLVDPDHTYGGWGEDYQGTPGSVLMTGFCHGLYDYGVYGSNCPPYSYVQLSDVQPYFDIAKAYGFANYMFQSNQGPSLPAHLFLFTGTSAPVAPSDKGKGNNFYFHDDYVSLVPLGSQPFGCYDTGNWPPWVQPDGSQVNALLNTQCYTHDSLVTDFNACSNPPPGDTDYCDRGIDGLSSIIAWGYYVEPNSAGGYSFWDAPAFTPEVCYGENSQYQINGINQECGGGPNVPASTEWSDHVRIPLNAIPNNHSKNYTYAPILDDILACNLPAVSWVIPDGNYSDHPRQGGNASSVAIGPAWVADIIDTVGQSYSLTGQKCDYWGYGTGSTNPQPTAIFVVWDDWGGWYDHVAPPPQLVRIDEKPTPTGYTFCDPEAVPPQWGCGYTDGFRVPFLAVSAYTPNYVSGACGAGTPNNCPHFGTQGNPYLYEHDFGSILAYTEWNFGMSQINLTAPGYADSNAPDSQNGNVPLSDFFVQQGRTFTYINTPPGEGDACFQNHSGTGCPLATGWVASDPDSY